MGYCGSSSLKVVVGSGNLGNLGWCGWLLNIRLHDGRISGFVFLLETLEPKLFFHALFLGFSDP